MTESGGVGESRTEKLRRLQARYERSLAEKLAALNAAWENFDRDDRSSGDLRQFHLLLHRLAGSGGTFGFTAVSEIGHRLEARVLAALDGTAALDQAARGEIRRGLAALPAAIRDPAPMADPEAAPLERISR